MNRLPGPRQHDNELRLAALVTAASCSQLFVRCTLQAWQLDPLVETAELLVSELVTNAVEATGVTEPHPRWIELGDLRLIVVRLRRNTESVFIEVWDSDSEPPVMPEGSSDDAHGRGLFLVTSMSSRWHYYHLRSGGKFVWCELPIKTATLEDTQQFRPMLERRIRRPLPPPYEPLHFMDDPVLLRRVHEGLKRLGDDSEGAAS